MTSTNQLVEILCRAIVASPSIRVQGAQQKYRNKITYSLQPSLITSDIAMDSVNSVAKVVDAFLHRSDLPVTGSARYGVTFWNEVSVKINRRGEFMIKIVFTNPAAFDEWMSSQEPGLLRECLEAHVGAKNLVCLVAHVAKGGPSVELQSADHPDAPDEPCTTSGEPTTTLTVVKPGKLDHYIPLLPNEANCITEYTPNDHPFILSPDSFCEVNHCMEDAIYHATVEFLGLDTPPSTRRRSAFMTGRDINSVYKTFAEFYNAGVTAVSTCPRVLSDTHRNGIACIESTKDQVWTHLKQSIAQRVQGNTDQHHILITAGRHGLHPATVKEMVHLAQTTGAVDDVLYVSCNVESMIRDMFIFKEAFVVAHCRTFDFFPGTDYVMSVVHFKALPPMARSPDTSHEGYCSAQKSVLVLPVGPPGAGKSSAGRALAQAFSRSVDQAAHKRARELNKDAHQRSARGIRSIARALDTSIAPCVSVQNVERDKLFANARAAGASLAKAREAVHKQLLSSLSNKTMDGPVDASSVGSVCAYRVVYLDSTNGSAEARALYQRTFASSSPGVTPTVITIFMGVSYDVESTRRELLRRCQQRQGHPAFPLEVSEQERKIDVILQAIEPAPMLATKTMHNNTVYRVLSESQEAAVTNLAVAVITAFHVFCMPATASTLLDDVDWDSICSRWIKGSSSLVSPAVIVEEINNNDSVGSPTLSGTLCKRQRSSDQLTSEVDHST